MRLWRNARIRTKIGFGLLLALLGVVGFAAVLVADKRAEVDESAQVRRVATLAVELGDLLHETQRERGRTAQFTSARGTAFGAELKDQRALTDQRLAEYRGFVHANTAGLPAPVRAVLDPTESALGRIAALREQADRLRGQPGQIIGGYTEINQVLLAAVAVGVRQNRNPTVAVQLQAYLALLSAKEAAGIERAQLANVFTVGRFADGQLNTVVSLMAGQQAYLTVFERAASGPMLKRWEQVKTSSAVADVAAIEKVALAKAATGEFGVQPKTWFDAATNKINLYKEVENAQAGLILDTAEAAEGAARRVALTVLLAAGTLVAVTLAIAVGVIASITRPLRRVAEIADRLAVGDVTREVTYRSGDELGRLADSFRTLGGYMRETAGHADRLANGDLSRTVEPRGVDDLLGNAMHLTVVRLGDLVGRIRTAGLHVSQTAERLMTANTSLVANSEETNALATTVSTASEEMIASITDISRSINEATSIASAAVTSADEAGQVVRSLANASAEISGVVDLIQAIASQTNLLALNASIEAARAGEAGKGFAVVADEVKQLAQQTAEATTTITQRVTSITQGASAAARAIAQIGEVVGRINDISATIGSAVEQQTATTSEISRSVLAVATAAGATNRVTAESADSARALATMATRLDELVAQFKTSP
jgi:methyl-accepting chemotaxis protein